MLTQQFFTRVQLAKILNFKSDSSIKDFEKKGFITPQIKPSKYTFNQVLFMMICKELTDFTTLSWKYFIDVKFNVLLNYNIIDYNLFLFSYIKGSDKIDIQLKNDNVLAKDLNDYLDSNLSKLPKLKEFEYTSTFHFRDTKDYFALTFSIERIYRRLHNKCIELKIDLKEKDTQNHPQIPLYSNSIVKSPVLESKPLQKVSKDIELCLVHNAKG
ncbi:MAG: hypothetical protein CUR34_11475 [Sediminibacterium sp.]|nr:MAG: hypothetical protein CUR34_11475 [Sediminibacterium sp.] [Sediminibacterium sp. FEMGT703S]